jgi:hypothetical protein
MKSHFVVQTNLCGTELLVVPVSLMFTAEHNWFVFHPCAYWRWDFQQDTIVHWYLWVICSRTLINIQIC